jgi:hypothetical protein
VQTYETNKENVFETVAQINRLKVKEHSILFYIKQHRPISSLITGN